MNFKAKPDFLDLHWKLGYLVPGSKLNTKILACCIGRKPERILKMAGDIFYVSLIITLVFGGTSALGLLDDTSNSDVNVVKIRLSEEKSKRLLIQNDVESIMLRMEEIDRTVKGKLKCILIIHKVEY